MVSPEKIQSIACACVLAVYCVLLYHEDLICHLQMLCGARAGPGPPSAST